MLKVCVTIHTYENSDFGSFEKKNANATDSFPFLDKMSLFLTDQYQVCNKIVKLYPVT